jgi:hypothetical protein
MIPRLIQDALIRAASDRRTMHGIAVWVLNDGKHASTDAMFATVGAALELIAQAQPWRLVGMRRDFKRIFVRENIGVRAMFEHSGTCVLDTFFVATFAPAQVASSIVHESVHARLRRGGRVIPRELVAWEERLCRKAELGFGLRVPGGEAVVERARASLSLSDRDIAPLAGDVQLRARRLRR